MKKLWVGLTVLYAVLLIATIISKDMQAILGMTILTAIGSSTLCIFLYIDKQR